MDNKPLVSILIPNYNKAPYLRETLDSVMAQTYTNWECIVVDDHSTDDSWGILEEYVCKDFRFKVYRRSDELDKGGNACRNCAFDSSKGNLILYLDSDDVLAEFCLDQRINAVNSFPASDFWAFPTALFQLDVFDAKYYWNVDDVNESDLSRFLRMDVLWQTSGPIYSREFVEKLGGFNPKTTFWQDYEVHLKALILSTNYQKCFDLPPDIFIREGDKSSLSRSIPFSSDLNILQTRIQFLEDIYTYTIKNGKELCKEELHSLLSFQYYLILQLWLKHGFFFLFAKQWNKYVEIYDLPFKVGFKGFIIALIMKLKNKIAFKYPIKTKFDLINIDPRILEKSRIGKYRISKSEKKVVL